MTFECGHGKDGSKAQKARALGSELSQMYNWMLRCLSSHPKDFFFSLVAISVILFRICLYLS